MLQYSNQKMVVAGDYVHLYDYQQANAYGYKKPKKITKDKHRQSDIEQVEQDHLYRTRKQVRLLLQSNIGTNIPLNRLQFCTYTFKQEIYDFKLANELFNEFTKRLNYELKTKNLLNENLKFICVPEIQHSRAKKYGVKVWHFHVIYFNLPAVWYPRLFKIWGNGGIKVKQMNSVDHIVNYLSKYFTKSDYGDYEKGQKKYFTSQKLNRPWEFRDPEVITELKVKLNGVGKPTFEKTYNATTWDGRENQTTYSLFKLTPENRELFNNLKSVL